MFNLKVISISKQTLVETEEMFLDVEFNIIKAGEDVETGEPTQEIVAERRLAFPLDTKPEVVQASLQKYLETFTLEQEQAAARAEVDKANKNADNVISELEGLEL